MHELNAWAFFSLFLLTCAVVARKGFGANDDWRKAPLVSAKRAIKVIGGYDPHECITITSWSLTAALTESFSPSARYNCVGTWSLKKPAFVFKSGLQKGRLLSDGPALQVESRPLLTGLHQRLKEASPHTSTRVVALEVHEATKTHVSSHTHRQGWQRS